MNNYSYIEIIEIQNAAADSNVDSDAEHTSFDRNGITGQAVASSGAGMRAGLGPLALKHWYPSAEPSAAPSPCLLHSFAERATPAAIVYTVCMPLQPQTDAIDKLDAAANTQAGEADTRLVTLSAGRPAE